MSLNNTFGVQCNCCPTVPEVAFRQHRAFSGGMKAGLLLCVSGPLPETGCGIELPEAASEAEVRAGKFEVGACCSWEGQGRAERDIGGTSMH